VDRLAETYWELQGADDPIGLEEFVGRASAGEYGPVTKDDLRELLREAESRLVHQIEQGEASAHEAAAGDDLIEETRSWIEELIARFCEE
jgi:hypothetical protein